MIKLIIRAITIITLGVALSIGSVYFCYFCATILTDGSPEIKSDNSNIAILSQTLSDPIDCVVLIETAFGLGSGVVISEDGIILTAGHMLEYGLPEKVTFKDGTEWTEFEALFVDYDADVGLFKIEEVFQFPCLLLGDSNELEIGAEVWAIGMPFGEKWWHCYGYISKESEKGRLFMSMPLNPGNSGCPILNEANEIVGICTDGILPGNSITRGHTSNICSAIIDKYRILFEL